MVEPVKHAFTEATVGALLNELILSAKRVYRCKEDCKNLVATLECIDPLLASVQQSSHCGNVTSQVWLKDFESLLVKAKGVLQYCDKLSRCSYVKKITLSSKIQSVHHSIQGKLIDANLVILSIVQRIDDKVTCLWTPSPILDQSPSFEMQHTPPLIARFEDNPFKKLKELILSMPSSDTKTIGLNGRGGAGKTLLAKMVNNDEDIRRKYGDRFILWITIGQDMSISSIYKRMGEFLNDGGVFERDIGGRDLEAQRTYLMEAFKQKRALVILDDVWGNVEKNHPIIYWLDIFKGDGSTTLITTRDNKVLDRAKASKKIEVESLSKEESWKLFSFHAFQPNIPPSHGVKAIAMEICNECKGHPLALEVIGGALWDTKDERGWKYALSCLKGSESWMDSATIEDELFGRLRFSYDVLTADAKKCFLYFAAFPEDYVIPTKDLCSIWQAEDLFGAHNVEDALNMGQMNLIMLADRSLIELSDDGEHTKIHKCMRDLAMRIIRNAKIGEWAYECQFEPGKELETLPRIKGSTKRVSFVGTHVIDLDSQLCHTSHNLRICLLSSFTYGNESGFSNSLPRNFFSNMDSLLYLNLSECSSLEELPESIKELKSLTHLILRGCESLKELPKSIKELKSLTHLDLSECESLKELPHCIKGLKYLIGLDSSGCEFLHELPESIKESSSLMRLYLDWCLKLVKSHSYVPINEPEEYLKLMEICVEQVRNITSSVTSSSLKFNNQQCKYLADKLESVVLVADSFLKLIKMKCLQFPCQKESLRAYGLKIFKLFYVLAKEVEDFIQRHCVKDAWIQAAMSLTNVSEYVSAIGFDMELWKRVFSQSEILEIERSYSLTDVDTIFKGEVANVKEKALGDKEMMLRNVNVVLEKDLSKTSAEFQLAALVLNERLKGAKSHIDSNILQSRMMQLEELVLSSLEIKKPVGKGSAAVVFEATLLGGQVAMKTFEGLDNTDFNKEVSVLRGLSHPNIISLFCSGTYRRRKCAILVELMDGDLGWLIGKRLDEAQSKKDDSSEPPFDIMEAVDVMLQIGRGMEYLHEMGFVHRDLKANNILVRRVTNHKGIEYVVAKVADFGLSKTKNTITCSTQTLNQGTTRWMAPEMIITCAGGSEEAVTSKSKDEELKYYPFKSDIYSFGMVCFEILTGHIPFPEVSVNNEVKKLVLAGERPSLPKQCHPLLECLIKRCWSTNPIERPNFGEICAELRHLKCLLLTQTAFEEVKLTQSANISKQETSASNTSTIGVFRHIILFFLFTITILCMIVWFRT